MQEFGTDFSGDGIVLQFYAEAALVFELQDKPIRLTVGIVVDEVKVLVFLFVLEPILFKIGHADVFGQEAVDFLLDPGIIAGGIAEYASLAFGYNALLLFAAGMYFVSLLAVPRRAA